MSDAQPVKKVEAPPIWSHSRMGVFEECPKKYEYEYVLKQRADRTESTSTIMGSRLHEAIEDFYTDGTVVHPSHRIDERWRMFMKKLHTDHLLPEMQEMAAGYNQILWRASAECQDPSVWIRNRDGSIPKGLSKNAQYIKAMESLNLDTRMGRVDAQFRDIAGPQFKPVSITKAYSDSVDIIPKWRDPEILAEVTDIEFPISHRVFGASGFERVVNEVYLPNGELFNGYIDIVGKVIPSMVKGSGVLLGDWKSSQGDAPSPLQVRAHQQLNKYVWAYAEVMYRLTGVKVWADYTAIGWLRTGDFVVSAVDPEYVEYTLTRQDSVIDEIANAQQRGKWLKRDPLSYNSPCLSLSKDGSKVQKACGHLSKCWPKLFAELPSDVEITEPPADHVPPAPLSVGFGNLF